MKRLIDANELLKKVGDTMWYHYNALGTFVEGAESERLALFKASDIFKAINEAPTVRIKANNLKGEWVSFEDDITIVGEGAECSTCGAIGIMSYSYCPDCGAKMR